DRFGAPGIELNLFEPGRRMRGDARQRIGATRGGEGADRDLVDLLLQDLAIARMRVTERVDADAGGQIEKAIAVDVLDHRAVAACDRETRQRRNGLDSRCQVP